MLYDNHGRLINYLRLAVTDRCNLRCFYCMPEEGINYKPRKELLTFEEMERFVRMVAPLGIEKIRITGGEPFLRKGIHEFIQRINEIEGIKSIHVTTNGTRTKDIIPHFDSWGIKSVNLSLDSLDPERFFKITRRREFDKVMESLNLLLEAGISTKINAVVMKGKNIDDILPMIELARDRKVDIRFIEEMPFNGSGKHDTWTYQQTLEFVKSHYPQMGKIKDAPFSTSFNYQIPDFQGSIGFIPAYTRLFCGTCNRIRLTPEGMLKTCLYDDGVMSVRDILRAGHSDEQIIDQLKGVLNKRAKDGFEAENKRKQGKPVSESMATIGG
ncbi:MAG: GTP 3',8-cyclase MoaA [Bacteroidota bacterium]